MPVCRLACQGQEEDSVLPTLASVPVTSQDPPLLLSSAEDRWASLEGREGARAQASAPGKLLVDGMSQTWFSATV